MVAMWRHPEGLSEGARKMVEAQIDESGESRQRNIFREVIVDKFRQPLLLPRWQAAAKPPHHVGRRMFQSGEFVHQYKA